MALGALVVRIGADLTDLTKGLTDADKAVAKAGKNVAKLGEELTQSLTVPILGVVAALGASAISVGKFADQLLDLADQTGLSTDTLQEFRHVATVAGVDSDALANAAIKLTSGLKSSGEQSSQLTGAIGQLGISVKDTTGNLRPMDALLPDIIKKLAGVQDVTTRNAIAGDIFGKSWAELAPVLSLGAAGIDQARAKAHELGLVMSNEGVESADAFRATVDTLGARLSAMKNEVGLAAIEFVRFNPAISAGIATVLGLTAAVGPFLVLGGKLAVLLPRLKIAFAALSGPIGLTILAVGALVTAGVLLWKNWDKVKVVMAKVWESIKEVTFRSIDSMLGMLARLTGVIPGLGEKVAGLQREFRIFALDSLVKSRQQVEGLERNLQDLETPLEEVAEATTVLRQETFKLSEETKKLIADGLKVGTRALQDIRPELYNAKDASVSLKDATDRLGDTFLATKDRMDIYRELVGDTDAAEKEFIIRQEALNKLLEDGAIDQRAFNDAMKLAKERLEEARQPVVDLDTSFGNLIGNVERIASAISPALGNLVQEFEGKFGRILTIIQIPGIINDIKTDWVDFFNNLADAISTFWGAIKDIAGGVSKFFLDIGAGAGQIGSGGGITINTGGGGTQVGTVGGGGIQIVALYLNQESALYRTADATTLTSEYARIGIELMGVNNARLVGIHLTLERVASLLAAQAAAAFSARQPVALPSIDTVDIEFRRSASLHTQVVLGDTEVQR